MTFLDRIWRAIRPAQGGASLESTAEIYRIRQRTVRILDVNVACLDVDQLLNGVLAWSKQKDRRRILYVNAHCLNLACADLEYRRILNCADLVYSDGISVVWAGRFLDNAKLHKITGADWIYNFSEIAEAEELKIYILAGKPGIAGKAKNNLLKTWPGLKIVGMSDGYFFEKKEAEVLQEISCADPHVLFVGMGTPGQEKWIEEKLPDLDVPVIWAVGAMFDFVAGVEPRVPAWMNALGLEWFWRLMMDPAGKWRRYLIGNPFFVCRVLQQKILQQKWSNQGD